MSKINLKHLIALICIISNFYFAANYTFARNDNPKIITGTVVYSDNHTPVNEGIIKVFKLSKKDGKGCIMITTQIQQNGEFELSVNVIQNSEDGIRIMAYPNDIDNLEPPFHPNVVDMYEAIKGKTILIEVERGNSKQINKSAGESKIILKQNFPNPFNPTTLIRFELPQTSNITLKVYNMSGESVATLVDNKNLTQGLKEFEFNASDLPSGIYIYKLTAGDYYETKKMMLLK